ncbi:STN domain-containing protein [Variovorax boronicumulans]|uniref:STN domain-containing protein n=1 Tax=Variovorax boronicumulans TaxID=436515 RepID=UPI0012E692A9|nr:STN domain-containing protein [Variovorax boronicumulans]GER10257.1 TonB-dependent outer membrane receptor [Variovorax boronicumulans]
MTLILGILSLAAVSHAGEPAPSPDAAGRIAFDLPAQPLATAVQVYAQATGQSVFFDGQLTAGLESAALHGLFTPREALQRLLAGTRLAARHTDARTFTLVEAEAPPPVVAPAPPVPAMSPRDARVVQQALERTLCRWPHARPGTYRALVQLWVGPGGHVRRTRLLSSTGLAQRDAALEAAMNTLVLDRPPEGEADQPLTVLLLPRTGDRPDVCDAAVSP